MFDTQERQTLGLIPDPAHPALAGFPTAPFQDWQWAEIVAGARAIVLDDLPRALRPIVRVIDDWNTNRRLALAFECRVGKGAVLSKCLLWPGADTGDHTTLCEVILGSECRLGNATRLEPGSVVVDSKRKRK